MRGRGVLTETCAICGQSETVTANMFLTERRASRLLKRRFNRCGCCGRWVCNRCFVNSDTAGIVGLCRDCANKKGITGITTAQIK